MASLTRKRNEQNTKLPSLAWTIPVHAKLFRTGNRLTQIRKQVECVISLTASFLDCGYTRPSYTYCIYYESLTLPRPNATNVSDSLHHTFERQNGDQERVLGDKVRDIRQPHDTPAVRRSKVGGVDYRQSGRIVKSLGCQQANPRGIDLCYAATIHSHCALVHHEVYLPPVDSQCQKRPDVIHTSPGGGCQLHHYGLGLDVEGWHNCHKNQRQRQKLYIIRGSKTFKKNKKTDFRYDNRPQQSK